MLDAVQLVEFRLTIIFADGQTLTLTKETQNSPTRVISILTNAQLSTQGQDGNPIGVITANTLEAALDTKDMLLNPNNTGSPYYGMMDQTARIKVELLYNNTETSLGTFFIADWVNSVTDKTPFRVSLTATDLMEYIGKQKVPRVIITKDMTVTEYLQRVVNALNGNNPLRYNILWDDSRIDFGEFNNMTYVHLNTSDMRNMLNTIAQCTLTNITIDHNNTLVTDYAGNDSTELPVMEITEDKHITSASTMGATIANYDRAFIQYSTLVETEPTQLAQLSDIELIPGENKITGVTLSKPAISIHSVLVSTPATANIEVFYVQQSKDTIDISIMSSEVDTLTCGITVNGIAAVSDLKAYGEEEAGRTLTVPNRIIQAQSLSTFKSVLENIIVNKRNEVKITGILNPALRLGDVVTLDIEKAIKVKGKYKVTAISIGVTSSVKYSAVLTSIGG